MARRIRVHESFITYEYSDIHPDEIWDPDGPAFQWCLKTSAVLEKEAKRTAPGLPGRSHARWKARGSSTGNLRRGISAFGLRTGPNAYNLTLMSAAPYSEYVHGGTAFQRGGYIYSSVGASNAAWINAAVRTGHSHLEVTWQDRSSGRMRSIWSGSQELAGATPALFLKLPPGAGFTRKYYLRVRGQLANAFLYRAWNYTNEDLARGEMGEVITPIGFVAPPGVKSIAAR